MIGTLLEDARQMATMATSKSGRAPLLKMMLSSDGYAVLALDRLRRRARKLHVPFVNHALRVVQTAYFGIEIGKDVTLGKGVWFIHPLGIVIGGNAKIGDRVRFFGNNTVGTAKENGYPTIGDDVWVGAGARILGPVTIGARAKIGANAVVVTDVPPDSVAVGIPARVRGRP